MLTNKGCQKKQRFSYWGLFIVISLIGIIFMRASYAGKIDQLGLKTNSTNDVHVAVYLKRVFDVNVKGSYIDVKYRLYLTHPNSVKDILNNIRLMNGKNVKLVYSKTTGLPSGEQLTVGEYTAQIYHHFKMVHYPFDTQLVKFVFEDRNDDVTQVKLIPTKVKNTLQLIDSHALVYVPEWRLSNVRLGSRVHQQAHVFENSLIKKTKRMPEVVFHVELNHLGWRQFVALYSTLYLAVVLSLISLLFPPSRYVFNARVGLLGAAVWSIVGNHILTHGVLRNVSIFNLTDKLQLLTSLYVASALVMTLVMTYCIESIEYEVRQRYYWRFASVITGVFIVLSCFFILSAVY